MSFYHFPCGPKSQTVQERQALKKVKDENQLINHIIIMYVKQPLALPGSAKHRAAFHHCRQIRKHQQQGKFWLSFWFSPICQAGSIFVPEYCESQEIASVLRARIVLQFWQDIGGLGLLQCNFTDFETLIETEHASLHEQRKNPKGSCQESGQRINCFIVKDMLHSQIRTP